ncbi:MAG: helix-turn-helix domain-containing protein [Bacteroidales bacterium]|nr:helix-turn-helix domain-containing protein [Bacteroidales bacterium]
MKKYISEAELKQVTSAIKVIGEQNGLKPIFEYLNNEVSFDKIRLGLALVSEN